MKQANQQFFDDIPQSAQNRQVVMVVYPDAHILDVTGPLEILSGSKLFLPENINPYQITVVAHKSGPLQTTSGLTIQADQDFSTAQRELTSIDTLMICGGHGTLEAIEDESLLAYVSWAAKPADRVVSICTGAMILATLGLLDGRRATSHWWWCPVLQKRYPQVRFDADALYVQDGKFWTSAGVTAGMDLCLALVEADWGHDIAIQVARYNVMYMMRPGGQSQFSSQLIAQQTDDHTLSEVLAFIQDNLKRDLTTALLAQFSCTTERTLTRKFKAELGTTPARYVELSRVQAARVALEQTSATVESIADNTGFIKPERMRRAFQRHLGISASDYRDRFRITHQRSKYKNDTEP